MNESHKVVWLSQKINAVRLKHTKTCFGGINDLDGDEDHIILGAFFGGGRIEDGDE